MLYLNKMNDEDIRFRELTKSLREEGYDIRDEIERKCEDFLVSGKDIKIFMTKYKKEIYENLEKEYQEKRKRFGELANELTTLLGNVQQLNVEGAE